MRRYAAVLAVLAWSGDASAGPIPCEVMAAVRADASAPEPPKIGGPDVVAEHKLVRLTVTGIPVGHFILFDVYPFENVDPATQVAKSRYEFAAPPGVYRVRVRAFKPDSERPLEAWHTVTVGGKPTPPPVPPPAPVPDPLGLEKASRDGAAELAGPNKVAEAKALAGAARGLASAVAAGGVPATAAAVMGEWRRANNAAVPDAGAVAAWNSAWGAAVSAKLKELHGAGRLPDKAAWTAAFNSIADGLEG